MRLGNSFCEYKFERENQESLTQVELTLLCKAHQTCDDTRARIWVVLLLQSECE